MFEVISDVEIMHHVNSAKSSGFLHCINFTER